MLDPKLAQKLKTIAKSDHYHALQEYYQHVLDQAFHVKKVTNLEAAQIAYDVVNDHIISFFKALRNEKKQIEIKDLPERSREFE